MQSRANGLSRVCGVKINEGPVSRNQSSALLLMQGWDGNPTLRDMCSARDPPIA